MSINLFGRELEINRTIMVFAIAFLVILIGVAGFFLNKMNGGIIIEKKEDIVSTSAHVSDNLSINATPIIKEEGKSGNEDNIKVYVVGCVKKEGVVTLKKGQIIEDAIKAAGGATKAADLRNINLVYELNDNEMLIIYSKKKSTKKQIASASSSSNSKVSGYRVIKDSGGTVVEEKPSGESSREKININTATDAELDTLPGVGPATAQKILAYREQCGNFKTIDDIKNVSGIGDSKFNDMKDSIAVK